MASLVYCVLHRQTSAALVLLLLCAAPFGQAQDSNDDVAAEIAERPGTPITFYGHLFEHGRGNPMPINTQFPDGEDDYSIGNAGPCGAPPPAPDDSADCENLSSNEQFFFTTPGFVQAKSREEFINNGRYEQLHNERGQTKDIYLDTDQNPTASFYMSADFHGWLVLLCAAACWNWDPGYFQDWTVEAWIWSVPLGEAGSGASERPDMGPIASRSAEGLTLLANGRAEPKDLASFDPTLPLDPICGGPCQTVHEFPIELEWDESFIQSGGVVPKENDLVFEFEWYQYTDEQKYILSTPGAGTLWNVNGGEDYPNRAVLPVRNPLDVELVFPTFVHDKLVVLSVINTPWGSYDVDKEETTLTVHDAEGNVVPIQDDTFEGGIETSVSHAGHYLPIEGQWIWDYQAQGLEPGEYTVTVETVNFQHSARASTSASFTIDEEGKGSATSSGRSGLQSFDDAIVDNVAEESEEVLQEAGSESKDSPGFGMVGLFAIAALAFVQRRSRK